MEQKGYKNVRQIYETTVTLASSTAKRPKGGMRSK